MTSRDFCYWLRGYLSGTDTVTPDTLVKIAEKLDGVKHTDPPPYGTYLGGGYFQGIATNNTIGTAMLPPHNQAIGTF